MRMEGRLILLPLCARQTCFIAFRFPIADASKRMREDISENPRANSQEKINGAMSFVVSEL
jgi:hypothetical protein